MCEDSRWKKLSRCECFTMDLHSKQWGRKYDNKQDEAAVCGLSQCVVIGSMAYSFGGLCSDKGRCVYLNETFSLDCERMRWKKVEVKGSKPSARSSCGLCAAGEKLVMYGGFVSQADRGGVQYKNYCINDCWEFCPREGNRNVVSVCEMIDSADTLPNLTILSFAVVAILEILFVH